MGVLDAGLRVMGALGARGGLKKNTLYLVRAGTRAILYLVRSGQGCLRLGNTPSEQKRPKHNTTLMLGVAR
jgi:hypothetical protein